MKCEIAYVSFLGNTEKLANGIADRFPVNDVIITNLSNENIANQAEIYLLGFGVNNGTIPLKIIEALEEIHNKEIMFFITCGMEPEKEYRDKVEKHILPFLQDDCDYRGIFMCQGKFPDKVIQAAKVKLEEDPQNKYAEKILLDDELSSNHPNATDYDHAYQYIIEHL